jgi:polyribonucleotide nucleotidyltransferase
MHILQVCGTALAAPRTNVSEFAPVILTIAINPEKIGEVIGTGGKVINGIIEDCKATSIDIEEDGTVFITAPTLESATKARATVEMIVRELKPGEILEGEVVKLLEFGAIVEFGGGKSGMIHVSELKDGFVKNVTDVVKVGDKVKVKVLRIENGKTSLSMKAAQV